MSRSMQRRMNSDWTSRFSAGGPDHHEVVVRVVSWRLSQRAVSTVNLRCESRLEVRLSSIGARLSTRELDSASAAAQASSRPRPRSTSPTRAHMMQQSGSMQSPSQSGLRMLESPLRPTPRAGRPTPSKSLSRGAHVFRIAMFSVTSYDIRAFDTEVAKVNEGAASQTQDGRMVVPAWVEIVYIEQPLEADTIRELLPADTHAVCGFVS
jgi:hypothetical protein